VQLSLQPAFNGGTASYTDIGRYPGANGAACVRIRELLPDLRTLLDRCDLTAPSGSPVGQFTLAPSQFDGAMWLVGVADRMVSWGCTLPSGAACGGGMSVAIDDQQSYWLVLGTGPVTVMDGGVRADHVTLTFDDVLTGKPLAQVDVAVPPA
jgi:hypothetical protein